MPTPLDYYYMFLSRAVTNCDTQKLYLYDKNTDSLFRLINKSEEWISLPNNYFSNEEKKAIDDIIPRYKSGYKGISILETLSLDEMTVFVQDFINQLPDEESKEIAREILNPKDLISPTHSRPQSKEAFNVLWNYSVKLNAFLESKYQQFYYPLGVNENSLLVW